MRIILLTGFLLCSFFMSAQESQPSVEVFHANLLGKTEALSQLEKASIPKGQNPKKKRKASLNIPNFELNVAMPNNNPQALPKEVDPLVQNQINLLAQESVNLIVEPTLVFEGLDENESVGVPDVNGDVSNDHYIQTVNAQGGTHFKIWDKEGNVVQEATLAQTFWGAFNVQGFGDPVVLWDKFSERWFITEFGDFQSNVMLVAVSETSDPLGAWYAYELPAPSFPDYPKFAITNDALVITTNEFSDSFIPVYVMDKQAMVSGQENPTTARLGGVEKFVADNAFQVASPVNMSNGNPSPVGGIGYVVRIHDDAWDGGTDNVELWEVQMDWDNEVFEMVGPTIIDLAPFDSDLCNGNIYACVEQGNGENLVSVIQQVIMNRAQYRFFGSHESIILNFSVDVNPSENQSGIRWVELRKESGASEWTLYQEGTFAPDASNRFMGSMAMDAEGNILMGYATTGNGVDLTLRYTGRLNNDPLGVMTIEEFDFANGEGIRFQAPGNVRWGDYFSMSIDPADDKTFWFTGEYNSNDIFRTKIMSAVIQRDSIDIRPYGISSPISSIDLGENEIVNAQIVNVGINPVDSFTVGLIFEGQPIESEQIQVSLASGDIYDHAFSTPLNMDEIKDYELKIYTSLAQDTVYYNDTLRRIISKLPRHDASLSDFFNDQTLLCDSKYFGGLNLVNSGFDTLFSAQVDFSFNEAPVQSIDWEGILLPGQVEFLDITDIDLNEGVNEFEAIVSFPNGTMDQNVSNDTLRGSIESLIDGVQVRLSLTTDTWPSEISWDLKGPDGEILFEGGNYSEINTQFNYDWCLKDTCYTFTIYDSYGDGISLGEGDFTITRLDNNYVIYDLDNPDFGTQLDVDFCTAVDCGGFNLSHSQVAESTTGASDGVIILQAINGAPPYLYSIDGGDTFESNPLFENLSAGAYFVMIKDNYDCVTSDSVVVDLCNLSVDVDITGASDPNTNDGIVVINPVTGNPPFNYIFNGGELTDNNTFENLLPGVYICEVIDASGCIIGLDVTVGFNSSTQFNFYDQNVRIFPNPTEGLLYVEIDGLEGSSELRLDILDSEGKIMRNQRITRFNDTHKGVLSLAPYPQGVYYLRFQDSRLSKMVKVVKK